VSELARLFNAFAQAFALEVVAIKAVEKDHLKCLNKRLQVWNDGGTEELLLEGRQIQSRLGNSKTRAFHQEERLARSFATLMSQGRTKTTLRPLEKATGTPLQLKDVVDVSFTDQKLVKEILTEKHPPASPASAGFIVNADSQVVHPAVFNDLDARCIRLLLYTRKGRLGLLGWKREAEGDCIVLWAQHQRCARLWHLQQDIYAPLWLIPSAFSFEECRLFALNKNPGVCPKGVGETLRCNLAKAILSMTKGDMQDATGTVQLGAGQLSGIDAAGHAVHSALLLCIV